MQKVYSPVELVLIGKKMKGAARKSLFFDPDKRIARCNNIVPDALLLLREG